MTAMRRGWFHLASGAVVGRIFGFVSNLLLSRWLGPSELGLFNLVTTTIQTSDTLARFGGDYALNYELGGQQDVMKTRRGLELARALAQLCSLTTASICVGIVIWVLWGHGLFPSSYLVNQRFILTGFLLLMIASEGSSASAWEVLLVSHRTGPLALRNGLFFPLRLLFAAAGSFLGGVSGAMGGWSFIAVVQCVWLKIVLRHLWMPLHVWPVLRGSLYQLLKRGLPFYATNVLASLIFYPLLLKVAAGSGLDQIGYLRVGQILQQLFAFLPATLVPVLFLRLRRESSFSEQVQVMEKPLRITWLLLIEILLVYTATDQFTIRSLFGNEFVSALMPTRILLITALCECLAQLCVQPHLAAGQTRMYGIWQNSSAILAALLGWFWIPKAGLAAYLIVRFLYVVVPLIGFGMPLIQQLREPKRLLWLIIMTMSFSVLYLLEIFSEYAFPWLQSAAFGASLITIVLHCDDFLSLNDALRKS